MGKSIGVIAIHGIGEQTAEFDSDFRDALGSELGSDVREDVKFESIYYQELIQAEQRKIWEQMKAVGIKGSLPRRRLWGFLRKCLLFSFSDATTYLHNSDAASSSYRQVHDEIVRSIHSLQLKLEDDTAPVVIVAHSLGAYVISNYIWDAQHCSGIWSDDRKPSDIERFGNVANLSTIGCNIPLFVSELKKVEAFHEPNEGFEWLNYYDKDDILGWPLKPLSKGFTNSYKKVVTRDIRVNVGGWLKSWNPFSHSTYWTDGGFIKPLAREIERIHANVQRPGGTAVYASAVACHKAHEEDGTPVYED